jgi:hypothetical protein
MTTTTICIVTVSILLTGNNFIPVNKNLLFCVRIKKEKDTVLLIIEENLLIFINFSNKPPLWRRSLALQIWLIFAITEINERCYVLLFEAIL